MPMPMPIPGVNGANEGLGKYAGGRGTVSAVGGNCTASFESPCGSVCICICGGPESWGGAP
jgi:hypothetical protein